MEKRSRDRQKSGKRQAEVRQEPDIFMIWKRIREMDLDQGLRELQGPEARFREVQTSSERFRQVQRGSDRFREVQKKALKMIAAGRRRVMVIMATGKGKSLVFILIYQPR